MVPGAGRGVYTGGGAGDAVKKNRPRAVRERAVTGRTESSAPTGALPHPLCRAGSMRPAARYACFPAGHAGPALQDGSAAALTGRRTPRAFVPLRSTAGRRPLRAVQRTCPVGRLALRPPFIPAGVSSRAAEQSIPPVMQCAHLPFRRQQASSHPLACHGMVPRASRTALFQTRQTPATFVAGFCVGATYLPRPSPAKYCQQKRA